MINHFALAAARANSANRPDLEPHRGMNSSGSGAPDAIPSLTNSDPGSWIQGAGHQGARAPAPALGVLRRNHLHPKCPSVPPDHLGHGGLAGCRDHECFFERNRARGLCGDAKGGEARVLSSRRVLALCIGFSLGIGYGCFGGAFFIANLLPCSSFLILGPLHHHFRGRRRKTNRF